MKKTPMRRCVGCNISKPKKHLTRIYYYQGLLGVDFQNIKNGRGLYICKNSFKCLADAKKKKAVWRAFPNVNQNQIEELFEVLGENNDK